jgi:hypothetical protein
MALAMRLAVRSESALSMKAGLLDRPDGCVVVDRGFGNHSCEPQFTQAPERAEP